VVLPDPPEPSAHCEIPGPPDPPHCDAHIQELKLRYRGGNCGNTTNWQFGWLECSGDAGSTQPVRIKVRDSNGNTYLDTGHPADVYLHEVVDVLAAAAGRSELPTETKVYIYNSAGTQIHYLKIITSCQKPIDLGDRFGAIEIYGIDTKASPPVALGTEVLYIYTLFNNGEVEANNVTVLDDLLGPITTSPIPVIEPGEEVMLEKSALIETDTTNVAMASYSVAGAVCPIEQATAQVSVVGEPDPQICETDVQAMLLEYIGPPVSGPLVVTFKAQNFRNDPVFYWLTNGLQPGTVLALHAENDFTIDATEHGYESLGYKVSVYFGWDLVELIETNCEHPFVTGQPAPKYPDGTPSSKWRIVGFTQE
jgi:uncharacterized repeat protein (TIGR01451 family)